MRTIKLLKTCLGHNVGDILQVDNNVAFGLVDSKSATYNLSLNVGYEEKKETKEIRFGKRKTRGYKIK